MKLIPKSERRTVIVVNISNRSLPAVTITEGKQSNCSICLTGYGVVRQVKGLLYKHRNHSNCILKWLEIHGFVRQYEMPVDGEEKRWEDGGAIGEINPGSGNRGIGLRLGRSGWTATTATAFGLCSSGVDAKVMTMEFVGFVNKTQVDTGLKRSRG
ncbi:hypothetical protein R6Q57_022349 [Mikania cordata]